MEHSQNDREDAVLLIGFGGPNKPEDVRPFLENVTRGHRIPLERIETVVRQYHAIGGVSPITEITMRQAKALRALLRSKKKEMDVYLGMRHWNPSLEDTLEKMSKEGVRRALGIVLAPHRSQASWQRYLWAISETQKKIGSGAPQIDYPAPWHNHPLFIDAIFNSIKQGQTKLPDKADEYEHWIFTAHSVPISMNMESNYSGQVFETAHQVTEKADQQKWSIAYQSRSGRPEDSWLEPDVGEEILKLGSNGVRSVRVIPIGFVCDNVEVLYDLDIKAKKAAQEAGIHFSRARTVNDHPQFIEMLADLVLSQKRESAPSL